MKGKTLLLLDGSSIAYRAFFALPSLRTRTGLPTGAVYGFTSMLFKVLEERRPTAIVAAFDKSKTTFRHALAETYKAHRPATPDELRQQFNLIKEVLTALNVPVVEKEGFEADDLIGTLVDRAEKEGWQCLIVTGDLDALQLVSPLTTVVLMRKGISEIAVFNEAEVKRRFGVTPRQLPDFKALAGDASDNIPGLPGIGPKTASRLLQSHQSLEKLLESKESLPAKLRETLERHKEEAVLAKKLALIRRDVPLEEEIIRPWPGPNILATLEVFSRLEFRTLAKRFLELFPEARLLSASGLTPSAVRVKVERPEELERLGEELGRQEFAALAYPPVLRRKATSSFLALCLGGEKVFLLEGPEVLKSFFRLLEEKGGLVSTYDAKSCLHALEPYGFKPEMIGFDVLLAAYLVNPAANNELGAIAFEHAGFMLSPGAELPEKAQAIYQLTPILKSKIKLQEQEYLYYSVELPLAAVLADMEKVGVKVSEERLRSLSKELGEQLAQLSEEIYKLAGERFNLNSPRQLGYILFEKLGLKPVKKTKTGYSTDASVLEKLAEHEIVAKVLVYRQLAKLKSTYTDALPELIDPATGRLHTTFLQAGTATGRLASAEPNLQNIPVRDSLGRRIRQAFVAEGPDYVLLSADYSQIELRVLAHLSEDPGLCEAFVKGEDIHARTAAEIFGVSPQEVTPEMRAKAKVVNFGIVYGMSDYGLSQELKIEPGEAHEYIERYFRRYPRVKQFIERVIAQAREKGYVTTILNRRRYIPEILSSNRNQRQLGERLAINTTIQGSAADLIKKAMVDIHRQLKGQGFKCRMILQVHDELLFEVPKEELEKVAPIIKSTMEQALPFKVPIKANLKVGPNWQDMEEYEVE
ncbi:DNA polymerase I [Ammonifex degensii KC4]|uniref:DNA polymerase I n=1 Tax=Ammonifex degensii (strain DSM 10501 / KC4) TaxID=429009 RepID=C9RD30_AMMDK|nr:DNA polymerase I [Ammonifex degensii]ACX52157.1 DNA polymerase I [Ammonifex degensii KC4]